MKGNQIVESTGFNSPFPIHAGVERSLDRSDYLQYEHDVIARKGRDVFGDPFVCSRSTTTIVPGLSPFPVYP
jgi:hypothetical protein